ncbi:uncharacterized protein STEHIDRAFT_105753 [Stereum hirsutum FP-91666 SS1]|uniref:PAN2-PAN3 deadenylation complex subunit PAN3 n=1 Tax=Stereum hirsutum (strain FP-91666) TaxID=721885 RepID=R7RXJ3_STEHR|nr:uncharacterized protein STEHIDRAFT_105753 [Stereum hirsutum FP-91666 SS1]EIM80126.1 hypothetical protein STEHIDRAFT_105753 [Stereum hirsutum FP-91666 SS1]
MAFFARPQSANAAIKIVAPTNIAEAHSRLASKKDNTQRQCRNILIYGSCKFEDKGCVYYHPPRASTPPPLPQSQPTTPSNPSLSQAVNAPVFVPKSSTLPTSPTPPYAQARTPTSAFTSPTLDATEYDDNDHYDASNYYNHTEEGDADLLTDSMQYMDIGTYDMQDAEGQMMMPPEYDPHNYYASYPAQPTFIRQPLHYHLYTHPPPNAAPTSHYVSPDLRADLTQRSETLLTLPAPGLNLPEEIQGYHTLVPLENTGGERRKFGNWYSTVYRAIGKDGKGYVLRRVENFRLLHQAAFAAVDQWSRMRHPNIVHLHEAFTTRAFGDSSLVAVYTYHPNSLTLYDAHIKPKAPSFQNGRLQSAPIRVPEDVLWSYIIQIASAMKKAHETGMALRMVDVTKIIVTGHNRIRISACGLADILTYNPATAPTPTQQTSFTAPLSTSAPLAAVGTPQAPGAPGASNAGLLSSMLQQEDLVMFGRLIFGLCCSNMAAVNNLPKSLETMSKHYSADIKNVALFCFSKVGVHKHVGQIFEMINPKLVHELDELQHGVEHLENELASELENARLFRLLCKFGFINERPEFARDPRWSETGDRYIIKLFRDYVFHQVDEHGKPVVNMTHVLTCLNKLDAGTDERIMLVSRDEQSVLVVSYKEIKTYVDAAFMDLARK